MIANGNVPESPRRNAMFLKTRTYRRPGPLRSMIRSEDNKNLCTHQRKAAKVIHAGRFDHASWGSDSIHLV